MLHMAAVATVRACI